MDERVYQIGLSLLNNVGPAKAKELVRFFGSAEQVFREGAGSLTKSTGLTKEFVQAMDRKGALIRAEFEMEFLERNDIQLYTYTDPNYPVKLKNLEDAPIALYTKGKVDFRRKCVSVVGTRKATHYGKKLVNELIRDLSGMGVQIVSGLAHGIDRFAHEASLENDLPTIAVLGTGIDKIYPAVHRNLAERMLETGGLITEFTSGTFGDPANFPRRNRIVAGLSEATVIVESSEKGGSMITANLANDYNRDVFAFPGDVTKDSSKGCNNLIRRDKAHLITCAEDMIDILGWEMREKQEAIQPEIFDQMSVEEEALLKLFQENGQMDIDALSIKSKMNAGVLSVHLFNMEIKGIVQSLPGKVYSLS